NDYENYQIESESDNINFDYITTIFGEEEIIVDYDYINKIKITKDTKEINIKNLLKLRD
ncbi:35042_t:CDS:1, partial [Racocetra persica]